MCRKRLRLFFPSFRQLILLWLCGEMCTLVKARRCWAFFLSTLFPSGLWITVVWGSSAGGGAVSLGLVTTFALLFICRCAENRNRDALTLGNKVSTCSTSRWRCRHGNKESLGVTKGTATSREWPHLVPWAHTGRDSICDVGTTRPTWGLWLGGQTGASPGEPRSGVWVWNEHRSPYLILSLKSPRTVSPWGITTTLLGRCPIKNLDLLMKYRFGNTLFKWQIWSPLKNTSSIINGQNWTLYCILIVKRLYFYSCFRGKPYLFCHSLNCCGWRLRSVTLFPCSHITGFVLRQKVTSPVKVTASQQGLQWVRTRGNLKLHLSLGLKNQRFKKS